MKPASTTAKHTFAPVRQIGGQALTMVYQHDWLVYQADVQAAFLQGRIEDDLFVKGVARLRHIFFEDRRMRGPETQARS